MSIEFQFDADSHIYRVGKTELPGCTRVIDTGGLVNYRWVRQDIMERKSALGREVHRATLLFDQKKLDWLSLDEQIIPYVEEYAELCRQLKFKPELREHQCIGEANGIQFGMQIDAAGKIQRRDAIVELKCTVAVMPHHLIQTAGYALGLPKAGIQSALARFLTRDRYIFKLSGQGKNQARIIPCTDKEDAQQFLSLLWSSAWRRKHEQIYREDE